MEIKRAGRVMRRNWNEEEKKGSAKLLKSKQEEDTGTKAAGLLRTRQRNPKGRLFLMGGVI